MTWNFAKHRDFTISLGCSDNELYTAVETQQQWISVALLHNAQIYSHPYSSPTWGRVEKELVGMEGGLSSCCYKKQLHTYTHKGARVL